jgi:hypothetical protein
MFRKVAIALIAASMLTAPVMAQVPASTTKPAATTSSAVKSVTRGQDDPEASQACAPPITATAWPSTST